jgi:hypothetical protein
MSPKKKVLGVTLLLVIYVVIAIVGFLIAYYVKTNFLDQKTQSTPKVTPAPAPSGYQTYQSNDQQFSFHYPEELKSTEESIGFGVKTVELRSAENQDPEYVADIRILTVPKTLAKTIGQDFDEYYDMAENSSKTIKSPIGDTEKAEELTKIRNREINGLRAVDYTSVPSPNPDNYEPEIGTFVETGNNLIIFATSQDNRTQLDEVLKTFNYTQ